MAKVRSFVVRPDHFQRSKPPLTFSLVDPGFERNVEERIDILEKEIGMAHKTCQFFPVFYETEARVPNTSFHTINFERGICREVYVILTF